MTNTISCAECQPQLNIPVGGCCPLSRNAVTPPVSRSVALIEVISRIALTIFATYVSSEATLTFLAIGTVAGLMHHIYTKLKTGHAPETGHRRPVCAQGYMETLSSLTYPTEMNQIATTIFIADHIAHSSFLYPRFTGLFVGVWAGSLVGRVVY